MHMRMPAARFFEKPHRRRLELGIADTDPEQHRARLERGGEFAAVPVGDDIVEQLLERSAAETRAHQRGERHRHRAARYQHEARQGQRRDEADLVGEPGEERGAGLAAIARHATRHLERFVGRQHRKVVGLEAGGEQLPHGAAHILLVGEGGDRLAHHREARFVAVLGHGAVPPHPC
jgi:hypothetical protein